MASICVFCLFFIIWKCLLVCGVLFRFNIRIGLEGLVLFMCFLCLLNIVFILFECLLVIIGFLILSVFVCISILVI